MSLEEKFFEAEKFFREAIESNRLASGYLFTGADTCKKTEAVNFLSKALNCRQAMLGQDCSCDNCEKINNYSHPDIIRLKPSDGKKLGIEAVRGVIRRIYLKPYMGRRKVFIIEEADALTEEAQNAFLKTLEEPPLDSVIILMTQYKEKLAETIISRCQLIKFSSIVSPEEIDEIFADFIFNRRRFEVLSSLTQKIDAKKLSAVFTDALLWFRDALVYKEGKKDLCFKKADLLKISELASKYSVRQLEILIEQAGFLDNLVRRNINPKIALSAFAFALEE